MFSRSATKRAALVLLICLGLLIFNLTTVFAGFRRLGGVGGGVSWRYDVVVCTDGLRYEVAAGLAVSQLSSSFTSITASFGGATLGQRTGITLHWQDEPVFTESVDLGGDGTIDSVEAHAYALVYVPFNRLVTPGDVVSTTVTSTQGGNSTVGFAVLNCSISDPDSMPDLNNPFASDGMRGFDPRDGRANRDAHATAAIYCQPDGSIHIYAINNASQGLISFVVTPEEIAAVGVPEVNTVIDSGASAFGDDLVLYRLANGQFQLQGPGLPPETFKGYVFIWDGC